MRLLLVEDDPMIGRAVRQGLGDAGFTVDWVMDGNAAERALANGVYDLALLDLGLPGQDGMAVLKLLRRSGNAVPVLIVTARDAVADRIAGLNAGADDYVLKPYDIDELLARIRALTRRSAGRADSRMEVRGVSLNAVTHEATRHGEAVALSAREWAVLEALMARPGVVLSRAQLEEKLYSWKDEVSSNAVEVYVHGLRKKLGNELIQTVRGLGYVMQTK